MIKERKEKLLEFKILTFRQKSLRLNSHFKFYWDSLDNNIKNKINKYLGDSLFEKIYRFLYDDTKIYYCKNCEQTVKFKSLSENFHDYCSQKCVRKSVQESGKLTTLGYKHKKESLKQMSENHADFTGDLNPFKNSLKDPVKLEECKQRRRDWWKTLSKEEYKNICETFSKAQANSKNNRGKSKYKNGYFISERMNKKFWFRSSWEEKVCEQLESSKYINFFNMESKIIPYIDSENKKRHTRIDFYIINNLNNEIIFEVKPSGLLEHNKLKLNAIQKYCDMNNILFFIITEQNLLLIDEILKGIENENH